MSKVSLKEHLNSRIDDVKDSVKTAYTSMEKRLESMNEFRAQLREQSATFVTRKELWAALVVAISIIVSILIYFK